MKIRRIASLKTADEFQKYLRENNINLPFAEKTTALNTPYQLDGKTIGNRFAITAPLAVNTVKIRMNTIMPTVLVNMSANGTSDGSWNCVGIRFRGIIRIL